MSVCLLNNSFSICVHDNYLLSCSVFVLIFLLTISLSSLVPPFVKTVGPSLFYRLPGDSVSLSFTITGASPPVNISNKTWRRYKDEATFIDLTSESNTPSNLRGHNNNVIDGSVI